MVERQLPKLDVASSILVSRSTLFNLRFPQVFCDDLFQQYHVPALFVITERNPIRMNGPVTGLHRVSGSIGVSGLYTDIVT